MVAGFQAFQRATNFGIANVARESLWTVVSREEKFKAKNIVDGAVFRGADVVNAFLVTRLSKLMAVRLCLQAFRCGAGRWLGRRCRCGWAARRKNAPRAGSRQNSGTRT